MPERHTSTPSMRTVPESGAVRPASVRISVLLPAPLAPSRPNTSPALASSETSSSATSDPYRRVSRSTAITRPPRRWAQCLSFRAEWITAAIRTSQPMSGIIKLAAMLKPSQTA